MIMKSGKTSQCMLGNFYVSCLRDSIIVSNSLDPDQAQHFVGPNLGLKCLQSLSADSTSKPKS